MADNFTSPSTGVHERAQEYMRTIALAKETAVKQAKETIEAKWGPSPKAEPDTAITEKLKPFKKTVTSSKQKTIANMEAPTHGGMIAGAGQITPQRLLQPPPEPYAEQAGIAGQQRSFQQQLSLNPEDRTQLSRQEQRGLNLRASTQYHYRPQHLSTPEHSQQRSLQQQLSLNPEARTQLSLQEQLGLNLRAHYRPPQHLSTPGHSQQQLTIAPNSNPPPSFPQPSQLVYQQPQITIPKHTYDNLHWKNSALSYLIQKQTGCTIEALHDWLRNEHKDQLRRQQESARRNQIRQAQLQQAELQQATVDAMEAEMWRRIEEAEAGRPQGQKTIVEDTTAHNGGNRDGGLDDDAGGMARRTK